jgi:hypothetical protein
LKAFNILKLKRKTKAILLNTEETLDEVDAGLEK